MLTDGKMFKKHKRKLKSSLLILISIAFIMAAVGSGSVTGEKGALAQQDNFEIPGLGISKTMTSGNASVPIQTKASWTLEIKVTYTDGTPLTNVIVEDTLSEQIDYDSGTVSAGSLKVKKRGKGPVIEWNIGTMNPGDVETLVLQVSTGRTKNQQNFLTAGTYELNGGATVTGYHSATDATIVAGPTSQITVTAY